MAWCITGFKRFGKRRQKVVMDFDSSKIYLQSYDLFVLTFRLSLE